MRLVALTATVFASALAFAVSPAAPAGAAENTNGTKPSQPQTVRVEPGDWLSRIAKENGTNYKRMFYANPEIKDPDIIYPGQELRVPAADEKLTPRPIPGNAPAQPAAQAAAAPAPASTQQAVAQPAYQPQPVQTYNPAPAQPVSASSGSVWDKLAECESSGNWSTNTGNGYYGGLQFSQSSWQAVGGTGLPSQASKAEQIARAEALQAKQGWGAWPACSAKLGL